MANRLGIFVSSDQHPDNLINLCKAARDKGDVDVTTFFSHPGTTLTKDPRF